jgi:hypothetical protein
MKKPLLILAASALFAVGCASQPPATQATSEAATGEQATAAIAAAKQSVGQAAAVDYEWRDSGKLIKEAEAAAKDKDYAQAVKLADEANQQGQVAVAQHAHETAYFAMTHGKL